MLNRRQWLTRTLGASTALALNPNWLEALQQAQLLTRAVPSTGEMLPLVGLGSSATFSQVARSEDFSALREVLGTLVQRGGKVFDTAPSYGASEQVAGSIASELGITDQIFWATKVNAMARGAQSAEPAAVRAQLETSFERLKKRPIDLIQVHNLADITTQLGILKELKTAGRVRYIGTTSTSDGQYAQLASIMRNEPLDFIGIDYAVDNRNAEEVILPLAQERKIGVLVYVPFGRTALFRRVGDRPVPDWAGEYAASWAQFFIKYVAANPAVTVVTPATSQARHMIDNLGGATGKLPDAATLRRMREFIDGLPS